MTVSSTEAHWEALSQGAVEDMATSSFQPARRGRREGRELGRHEGPRSDSGLDGESRSGGEGGTAHPDFGCAAHAAGPPGDQVWATSLQGRRASAAQPWPALAPARGRDSRVCAFAFTRFLTP